MSLGEWERLARALFLVLGDSRAHFGDLAATSFHLGFC